MSREFMKTCGIERVRLASSIEAKEGALSLYRQLWKAYRDMAEIVLPGTPQPAERREQMKFIEQTAVPVLKREIECAKESLENVAKAQESGCLELSNG